MSTTIDYWRASIGRFSGGRSGTSSQASTISSPTRIPKYQSMFIILIMATLTSQFTGCVQLFAEQSYKYQSRPSSPKQESLCDMTSLDVEQYTTTKIFSMSSKDRNKVAKTTNGNRANRGIKLAHWNAGSAHLRNKMNELEHVVASLHPHVLGISEANFKKNHELEDVQLDGYDLILSKTIENEDLQISKIACYKHNSMVGTVREDLMC